MRHKERRYGYDAKRALAVCGVLAASAAVLFQGELTAFASPTFSRTAEEWAVLQDDKLTWDEIPDLIHEYNATVRDNEQAYADDERNLMDAQDIREAMIDQADDYDNMAMDIAGSSEASAAQYRAHYAPGLCIFYLLLLLLPVGRIIDIAGHYKGNYTRDGAQQQGDY